MDFISNQNPQIKEMLAVVGVKTLEELFQAIPSRLRVKRPIEDDGISEYEGLRLMENIASRNTFPALENYLGAGAYEHHIPALVGAVCSKSEFLTSYTPYQAEASQGMLQIIFEFQSAICALTGMDAANASVYDGASACAEAVLMAMRVKKNKTKLLIAGALHPHYRNVVEMYLRGHNCSVEIIPFDPHLQSDLSFINEQVDDQTAAILIQSPNFFGVLEQVKKMATLARNAGALTILCANPLSYGIFAAAEELGADIAVGDCQPFGLALNYGGPYAGYMACRTELIRQMPGRIVGETVDTHGRRGFVLTLQAREQHIRREKATSNICTNQALAALASLVAMLWYGKEGIPSLALTNYQRTAYLRQQLSTVKGITVDFSAPIFNECVVKFDHPPEEVQKHFRENGIEPGLFLGSYYPDYSDAYFSHRFLICATETKNKEQLDRYVKVARERRLHD